MSTCYDTGTLRAHLDGELDAASARALDAHLRSCSGCRSAIAELHHTSATVAALLTAPAPDTARARARLAAQLAEPARRSTPMSTPTPQRPAWRRWAAPLAGAIAAAALLALPPVRAAADQLLQVFRVQTVVFVPVSQERLDQLSELNFDEKRLFIAEPKVIDEPAAPRAAASIDEASALAGFRVEVPAALPDGATRTQLEVTDGSAAELQVDVAAARELIALAGVSDISLPDALGEQPIRVDMEPAVLQRYESSAATISLMQARSPQVALPEGVDLSQLGRVALRVLGMAPEQADALASQIDWSSTLLVPFPADLNTVRQVSINGAPGMLVSGGRRAQNSSVLYWQRGDQIYVLQIESALSAGEVIDLAVRTAESVR